jgi:hypothetical protein
MVKRFHINLQQFIFTMWRTETQHQPAAIHPHYILYCRGQSLNINLGDKGRVTGIEHRRQGQNINLRNNIRIDPNCTYSRTKTEHIFREIYLTL